MSELIIYEKPTCTTCRNVSKILKEKGIDFNAVNYFLDPIPAEKLKELVKKMKMPAKDLIRTKEDTFKKLKLSGKDLSDSEAIALMVKHPELLQRPIAEKGSRAVLARPAERISEIL